MIQVFKGAKTVHALDHAATVIGRKWRYSTCKWLLTRQGGGEIRILAELAKAPGIENITVSLSMIQIRFKTGFITRFG
jgi:hypothetical protein